MLNGGPACADQRGRREKAMRKNEKTGFESDCVIWQMRRYYPNWQGEEKWLVVSDLCREELEAAYPYLATVYAPYVLITTAQAMVIRSSEANERKHRKRMDHVIPLNDEGPGKEAWDLRTETARRTQTQTDTVYIRKKMLESALKQLTKKEKTCFILHDHAGYCAREIAQKTGWEERSVYRALRSAKSKMYAAVLQDDLVEEECARLRALIRKETQKVIPITQDNKRRREDGYPLTVCPVCRSLLKEEAFRVLKAEPASRVMGKCDICRTRNGSKSLIFRLDQRVNLPEPGKVSK